MKKCRLCGSTKLEKVLELKNSPNNVFHLLSESELGLDKGQNLEVHKCSYCDFVQLCDNIFSLDFEKYLMGTTHSEKMNNLQKLQSNDFCTKFNLKDKKVIDIGCGDGNYMLYLQDCGCDVYGIDPSTPFLNEAREKKLNVYQGYVNTELSLDTAPYDAFVTRQVLEHIPDPKDFLRGIHNLLAEDSYGLIELQCLEQSLEQSRFYDFFFDRLNYFSEETVSLMLMQCGFEVLEVCRVMDGEYLQIYVKKKKPKNVLSLNRGLISTSSYLKSILKQAKDEGKSTAIWGAGAKGVTALAVSGIGKDDIRFIVDSDYHKKNKYLPVSEVQVVDVDYLQENLVDIIIISAMAYADEIVQNLKNDLGFKGEIYFLDKEFSVITA